MVAVVEAMEVAVVLLLVAAKVSSSSKTKVVVNVVVIEGIRVQTARFKGTMSRCFSICLKSQITLALN